MICWKCKKEIKVENVCRSTVCPLCDADLHCCKNCNFFSPDSHFECKETIDEKIVEKDKSNFCDYFRVKTAIDGTASHDDKGKNAKDLFNSLFGVIF